MNTDFTTLPKKLSDKLSQKSQSVQKIFEFTFFKSINSDKDFDAEVE